MDWFASWQLIAAAALAAERAYAVARRRRPHLPTPPLSRVGQIIGRIGSYEVLLATRDLRIESLVTQLEAAKERAAAQDATIAALRGQSSSDVYEVYLSSLPVGIPPTSNERRQNPHDRRRTRAASARSGGTARP